MPHRRTPLALILLAALFAGGASAKPSDGPNAIHLEAEDATLAGATVQTTHAGFSGAGYVGDFATDGAHITWTVPNARAGLYAVRIRFRTPSGSKGYDLVVNGRKSSGMFPASDAFAEAPAGKVELQTGVNTIGIERGWGYYEIDALDLTPAPPAPALAKLSGKPSDPQATPQARALLRSLVSTYGAKTLSGQSNWEDNQYVHQTTGQWPAILGMDLIEYSPTRLAHGSKPGNAVEDAMQEARQNGQIITVHWHWNAPMHLTDTKENPWWSGFYTKATTFDLATALDHPESPEYQKILSDMDAIAVQLQKYQAAGVPLLWRPLHEAEGGWFWWGAKGPEAYKKLWRLMYDRMTKTHKLHNLIWVYSSGTDPKWYPGDDVVDIVGIDQYPADKSDPLTTAWETLLTQYGGRKPIALSEFGGVPDVAKMQRVGVRWTYFMSWNGTEKMPAPNLTRLYTAPAVVNAKKESMMHSVNAFAFPVLLGLLCFGALPALGALSAVPPLTDAATYRRLANETEANLHAQVLAMWFPRAVDSQGGFAQNFGEDWTPGQNDGRAIVYQSRLTWVAAQAAMGDPAGAATYRGYARHGLDFLDTQMWDAQNGGFYWGLDDKGVPVRDGEKHAYGISFAIYAACAEYEATHDARALDLAQRAYHWLDVHAHDAKNGGYFEALTRQGRPILAPVGPQTSDEIGTRYGLKTMNTHIHLLESLSALYAVWPDRDLRKRLEEVFSLVRDKIAVESVGCLNLYFTPDWRPLPDHDSFGHDVETAFLLVEASSALGRPDDVRTWALARRIVDHALDFGWDGDNGGFYDAGAVYGGPFTTDKIWWVQAEGLNALLMMHARYGRETPRYWAAFNQQWNFVQHKQTDAKYGGWYATVTREGASIPGHVKSDGWTEAYHQGRALMNVSETLRRLAEGKTH